MLQALAIAAALAAGPPRAPPQTPGAESAGPALKRPVGRRPGPLGPGVLVEITRLIKASGADVAVAFRTLDGRDELLIQPDVPFHAASTMKVPVLIELFRQARGGALSLDDRIPIVNQFHSIVDGSLFTLDTGDDSDAEVYKHIGG